MNYKFTFVMFAFALCCFLESIAQTGPTISVSFSEANYGKTDPITFTITFDAGDDGFGTDYVFSNARAVLATNEIGGGNFANFQSEVLSNAINGVHSGTNVAFTRSAVGGSASTSVDLGALSPPRQHVMYIEYTTSDPNTGTIFGNAIAFTVIEGVINDSAAFDFSAGFIQQNTTVSFPISYNSDLPVAIGGIKFILKSDTSSPYSTSTIGIFSNQSVLPAGENMTASITATNFPAIYTVENAMGGTLLANEGATNQLLNANPNGAVSPQNAFYFLDGIAGDDPNFSAVISDGFRGISIDPTLGVGDLKLQGIDARFNYSSKTIEIQSASKVLSVYIYDLSGKIMKSYKPNSKVESFDVSAFPKGMYFAQIINQSGQGVLKFNK